MTPNNVPRTERPTDMTASTVISTPFRVRGGTRDALHHTAGSAPAPYALLRTPGSRGDAIGRNHGLTDWIDLVGDLLQRPLTELPVAEVAAALASTFDVRRVCWAWRDESGRGGVVSWPQVEQQAQPDATVHDVQRLAIPYVHDGDSYEAFVMSRPHEDFDACDLALAQRLQHLIRGLHLHARHGAAHRAAHRAEAEGARSSPERFGLTATELAVLLQLADGHTTYGIARRLGMAPRTASKHLEHIYRKLDVTHRFAAVNVGRAAGLVVGINGQDP
jgi:DNA-binding CsgD family transcriptional regulator